MYTCISNCLPPPSSSPHLLPPSTIFSTSLATSCLTLCAILFPSMTFAPSPGLINKHSLSGSRTGLLAADPLTVLRQVLDSDVTDGERETLANWRKNCGSLAAISKQIAPGYKMCNSGVCVCVCVCVCVWGVSLRMSTPKMSTYNLSLPVRQIYAELTF